MIKYFTLISCTLLLSCNLDGVQSADEESSDIESTSIDSSQLVNNVSDSLASLEREGDQPFSLLKDSIDGKINEMVYNGEGGLRVEWTKKNTKHPIALNDVVLVNYSARVAAGEEFDSNQEIGQPVPLKTNIGMLIEGWEKGLLKMHVGDIGRIMIPSAMAYGDVGYLNIVPPKADVIVEIEIVEKIKPIVLEEGVKVYKWKINPEGKSPSKNQKITFDYFAYTKGENGKRYDNSFKNSEPFSFKFENDNVIDGLHQGMSVLKTKENAFIEIPAKLAYGNAGLVDLVPKNADIVYDVRVQTID